MNAPPHQESFKQTIETCSPDPFQARLQLLIGIALHGLSVLQPVPVLAERGWAFQGMRGDHETGSDIGRLSP